MADECGRQLTFDPSDIAQAAEEGAFDRIRNIVARIETDRFFEALTRRHQAALVPTAPEEPALQAQREGLPVGHVGRSLGG